MFGVSKFCENVYECSTCMIGLLIDPCDVGGSLIMVSLQSDVPALVAILYYLK